MADLTRYDDWIAWLTERAASDRDVLAAWVGGSAATGGWDEWSDLDLDVLCTPGTSTAVYERWLVGARTDFDVHDVWEVPEHGWPDGRHCFLTLQERPGLLTEPVRIIDLHISDLSDAGSHLDVRPWRHDFGLRYLRDDLPADVADRLEALVPGHSPRSLRELSGECFAWIDELLA